MYQYLQNKKALSKSILSVVPTRRLSVPKCVYPGEHELRLSAYWKFWYTCYHPYQKNLSFENVEWGAQRIWRHIFIFLFTEKKEENGGKEKYLQLEKENFGSEIFLSWEINHSRHCWQHLFPYNPCGFYHKESHILSHTLWFFSSSNSRVATENLKQNSLTFPWLFHDYSWKFPDLLKSVESKFNK